MRRKDREVTDFNKIIGILDKCDVIRLAMVDNGEAYIVPMNFGYNTEDGKLQLFFHSAQQGRKVDIMQKNPHVCFEADCSFKLITDEIPCEWTAEHESVIGYGDITFMQSEEERKYAMDEVMRRYGYKGDIKYTDSIFSRTLLFKLTVTEITGKRHFKKA